MRAIKAVVKPDIGQKTSLSTVANCSLEFQKPHGLFWRRDMHEQRAIWGEPIDLEALATARMM
jgi:hypothetical protein